MNEYDFEERTLISSRDRVVKEDGRYIIFYSFDDDGQKSDRESVIGDESGKRDAKR